MHLTIEPVCYQLLLNTYKQNMFFEDVRNTDVQSISSARDDDWNLHEDEEKKETPSEDYFSINRKSNKFTVKFFDAISRSRVDSVYYDAFHLKDKKKCNFGFRWDTLFIYKLFKDYNDYFDAKNPIKVSKKQKNFSEDALCAII